MCIRDRPETAAEIDLLLRRDALVAEHQQVVIKMGFVDALELARRQWTGQVETEDPGAKRRIEHFDVKSGLENGRHGTRPLNE